MENILFDVKTRINSKNVFLFVTENLKTGIRNNNIAFISKLISPFQLAAFILSSLAGQLERNFRLEDKQCEVFENEKLITPFGQFIVYIGKRSNDITKFNLHLNSIKITSNAIDQTNPEKNLSLNYRLTSINSFEFLGKLMSLNNLKIEYYLLGEVKIVKKGDDITLKVGGGKPSVINSNNLDVLLFALERWLSGQSFVDRNTIAKYLQLPEDKRPKNRPYYTTRFNREGILFDGKIRANFVVNGFRTQLTYLEIAELFYVLKALKNQNN